MDGFEEKGRQRHASRSKRASFGADGGKPGGSEGRKQATKSPTENPQLLPVGLAVLGARPTLSEKPPSSIPLSLSFVPFKQGSIESPATRRPGAWTS